MTGGVITYFDSSHLTATYAKTLAPYLDRPLSQLLAQWECGTDQRGSMSTAPPLLSLVCAVHDLGEHLPAFFETVERQQLPLSEVEVVVVDCGSRDDSLAQLRAWARGAAAARARAERRRAPRSAPPATPGSPRRPAPG